MSRQYTETPGFSWPSQYGWYKKPAKTTKTIGAKPRFKMRVEYNHWFSRESRMTSGRWSPELLQKYAVLWESEELRETKNPYLGKQHFFVSLPVVSVVLLREN